MRLSEVAEVAGITVVRDGDFENLGFVQQELPRQLVFLEDARYQRRLLRNRAVAAVVTTPELAAEIPDGIAVASSAAPRFAFAALVSECLYSIASRGSSIHLEWKSGQW